MPETAYRFESCRGHFSRRLLARGGVGTAVSGLCGVACATPPRLALSALPRTKMHSRKDWWVGRFGGGWSVGASPLRGVGLGVGASPLCGVGLGGRCLAAVRRWLGGGALPLCGVGLGVVPPRCAALAWGWCLPAVRFGLVSCFAPVAQLDRASDYGSGGWGFESSRAHLPRSDGSTRYGRVAQLVRALR